MERIVVKVGSSQLVGSEGKLCLTKLQRIAHEISQIKSEKLQVVLVSSGAVAAGFSSLGYATRPKKIECIQASAAVGQSQLMNAYHQAFAQSSIQCAQILLTRYDLVRHDSFRNAFNTLEELLSVGAIPVINENDAVAIDELSFGDNDLLASLVAGAIQAHKLILLTDVDGLYTGHPTQDKNAVKLHLVDEISPEVVSYAQSSTNSVGKGGMLSKVGACSNALTFGAEAYVGHLGATQSLQQIVEGKGSGTYFRNATKRNISRKKQWIAFLAKTVGEVIVDDGASIAVTKGCKSLLPAGVLETHGEFNSGDVVKISNTNRVLLGKGICNYSSAELSLAMGKRSEDVLKSDSKRIEVVHRDDWVSFHLSR